MHSTDIHDGFSRSVQIEANSNLTSFAGLIAAAHHLRRCGLFKELSRHLVKTLPDRGQSGKVRFSAEQLVQLRILELMAGKEDLNDVEDVANDPGFLSAFGSDVLPSTATLCRFERKIGDETLDAGNDFLLDMFFRYASYRKYVYIDVDNTPVELFGRQENIKFNGHYGCNCYLPLLAFIDGYPVGVFNGTQDGRKVMADKFRRIAERIKKRWPDSVLILRADSGFNGKALIDLCDEIGCYYVIGLGPNRGVMKKLEDWEPEFVDVFRRPPQVGGSLLRHYGELDDYQAASWSNPRRVIVRDYWDENRRQWDPRFIQTNIPKHRDGKCGQLWRLTSKELYEQVYCARGTDEKYNQEFKVQAFGARASSTRFLTNSYRMLLGAICQLFYKVLRTTLYRKTSRWNNCTLTAFRNAFVTIPGVLRPGRRKVFLHLKSRRNLSPEINRFWCLKPD